MEGRKRSEGRKEGRKKVRKRRSDAERKEGR